MAKLVLTRYNWDFYKLEVENEEGTPIHREKIQGVMEVNIKDSLFSIDLQEDAVIVEIYIPKTNIIIEKGE